MHAPASICQTLYRMNPSVRLAWAGGHAKDGEMNVGSFALVQLFPQKIVGSLDSPNILEDLWYVTDVVNDAGQVVRGRVDRGPIFNRDGGTIPDWDMIEFIPVYVARLEDYRISNEVVCGGGLIPIVRRWMSDPKERMLKSAEDKGKELKRKCREIGEEAGKRLWHEAKKHTSSGPIVPYSSEVRKEMDEFYKNNSGIENYYMPNKDMVTR